MTPVQTPVLDSFGSDLTEQARQGRLNPLIGRAQEIERVIQVLSRSRKNNPVLLREPGAGATALIRGLALRITAENVPEQLRDKRIVTLDLIRAGARSAEPESYFPCIRTILEEVRLAGNVILHFEQLHQLVGSEGTHDLSPLLTPILARLQMQCIGATTIDEYRKYIEKDGALERRFQQIIVNPQSAQESLDILRQLRPSREARHQLQITEEALQAAVELAERYLPEGVLPGKAVDLLDRACAAAAPESLIEASKAALARRDYTESARLFDQARRLRHTSAGSPPTPVLTETTIARTLQAMLGRSEPCVRNEDVRKRLLDLERELQKVVVGQDGAIQRVAKGVRKCFAGLKDPEQPIGRFLFVGPPGVGKTLLAHRLAHFLYGDENALLRLDAAQLAQRPAVSRLICGCGCGEPFGALLHTVRRRPYCVVMIDHIEQAPRDLWDLLLQITDLGFVTDCTGQRISFRNTLLIVTTSLGVNHITRAGELPGAEGPETDLAEAGIRQRILNDVERHFPPEFLCRGLDDLIVFRPLHG